MAINFPNAPTLGQEFTDPTTGTTWVWDGVKWTSAANTTGFYVKLAGDTMTGALVLEPTAPIAAMDAAPKQYVDARGVGDNRLINGDMRIDQRNNGANGTAGGYTVDRWNSSQSVAGHLTWGRNLNAPPSAPNFPYCLGVSVSSAYTPAIGDIFTLYQPIEFDTVGDLNWGVSGINSLPVTISFWARASIAGTYSGALRAYNGVAGYAFSYPLPTANQWTFITINIPPCTIGAWNGPPGTPGTNGFVNLGFDLGCGSGIRGPGGAWVTNTYQGVTGTVQITPTVGATFYVTGVKLEIGSAATPWLHEDLAKSLVRCQRYFQTGFIYLVNGALTAVGQTAGCSSSHTPMRAAATTVITNNSNGNITSPVVADGGPAFYVSGTATATGSTVFNLSFNASAEI